MAKPLASGLAEQFLDFTEKWRVMVGLGDRFSGGEGTEITPDRSEYNDWESTAGRLSGQLTGCLVGGAAAVLAITWAFKKNALYATVGSRHNTARNLPTAPPRNFFTGACFVALGRFHPFGQG